MSINKIGINRTSPIEVNVPATNTPLNKSYQFKDHIDFSEIDLEDKSGATGLDTEVALDVLFKLFWAILVDGADIISKAPRVNKDVVIEAMFTPPQHSKDVPKIFVPIYNMNITLVGLKQHLQFFYNDLEKRLKAFCSEVGNRISYNDLIKLLILAAHEYGHYLSFQKGLHDRALKNGLYLMGGLEHFGNTEDRNQHALEKERYQANEKYIYQVFSEEATAWRFAEDRLLRYGFIWWDIFKKVKNNSLKKYYQVLKLKLASIRVSCEMSMLDVDMSEF